jgi:membrane protein DedA with SNARE-associated domain/rhodanese-related sulfurtransferase
MSYYLVHTTYLVIFVSVFARQLCLPVPALLFLISGGALAGSGKLNFVVAFSVGVLGCVLADLVWYEAGRLRGKPVLRLLCTFAPDPSLCIRRAKTTFTAKGLRLLLIAKFVPGLDTICPPMAGIAGASRLAFILHDAGGAAAWAAAYITGGFYFAKELNRLAEYAATIANIVVVLFGIPLLIAFVWKLVLLTRAIRLLRSHEISPETLKAGMESGRRVGIIDLLRFEDDPQDTGVIPGAVRLDPLDIRRKRHIEMPSDVDIVVYCRSKNSFVSARVAAVMRKHGIQRIRVLSGGLAAWQSSGFPVTGDFADPEAELQRLGIVVDPPWSEVKSQGRARRSA